MKGQRPGGRKWETAWRPCAWSTMSEAEVAGPGCHSGGFIYSKSAGEPLKDSAQSSELMELLFLKTQWLMCGAQVNSHRSREGRSLVQAAKGGDSEEHRYSGYIQKQKKQVLLKCSLYGMRGRTRSSVASRFLTLRNWEDKPGG